jgi:hypothetical protein
MANRALDLKELSQVALAAGMNQGFNCAEVQRVYDINVDANILRFIWGDRANMNARNRLETPMEWGRSYSEEVECSRGPRTLVLPEDVAFEASYDLQKRFAEALLEVASV